jgi:putative endonuclease
MKPIGTHNYFVYIITNRAKTVLYTGVTNDLKNRLYSHEQDALGPKKHFAGKYNAYFLIYWERFEYIEHAIKGEKEIKGWLRSRKEKLVNDFNPGWRFLNDEVR